MPPNIEFHAYPFFLPPKLHKKSTTGRYAPASPKYIFESHGLGNDFERECYYDDPPEIESTLELSRLQATRLDKDSSRRESMR